MIEHWKCDILTIMTCFPIGGTRRTSCVIDDAHVFTIYSLELGFILIAFYRIFAQDNIKKTLFWLNVFCLLIWDEIGCTAFIKTLTKAIDSSIVWLAGRERTKDYIVISFFHEHVRISRRRWCQYKRNTQSPSITNWNFLSNIWLSWSIDYSYFLV